MTRYLAGAACCVALATAALTACSSSGSGTPAPPGATVPHSVALSSAPNRTAGNTTAAAIDPCHLLTTAQVQPLSTPKLGSTKASTQSMLKPNDLHLCTFMSADGDEVLTVSASVSGSATDTFDQFRQSEDSPTDVAGVGDKAYRGDESPDVTAVRGDLLCMVDVADPGDVPGADRLYDENGHHTDIGAPAFDVIAKNLGTLCNRIFGSGSTAVDLSGLTALHPPAPTD